MKNTHNEAVETPTTVETQNVEVKVLGRPSDPTSKRQQILAKREAAKAEGTFRKGRPIVGTSKRQEVLAQRKAKIEMNGELRRGRPSVETSERQLKLKAKADKLASGIEIKRGRPKAEKVETVSVEVLTSDLVELERGESVEAEVVVEKVKSKRSKK
jgi:hypothetical protein